MRIAQTPPLISYQDQKHNYKFATNPELNRWTYTKVPGTKCWNRVVAGNPQYPFMFCAPA